MPEALADPPTWSCYLLFCEPRIVEYQCVDPDLFSPPAQGAERQRAPRLPQPMNGTARKTQETSPRAEGPRPPRGRSVVARAAVDVDGLAGDKTAGVADQKEAGGSDLVDMPLTAEWNTGGVRDPPLIPLGIVPAGVDAAGGDHVGPDVLRGELGGQGSRQPDQAHLRRRDVGASAAAGEGAFAGEKQDAAVLVLDHRADGRLRAVECAIEDDPPDVLPVLYRHLGEGLVGPDRGIVDQNVDAAELGHRLRHHRVDLIFLGDVGYDGERLDPPVAGFTRDGVGFNPVGARVDDDVSALAGQLQHRCAADIAAGTGHQSDFPVELTHQCTSIDNVRDAAGKRSPK